MAAAGSTPINVTPLIDVVLVLLIIFMVVTPQLNDDKGVELPETAELTGEEQEKDKPPAIDATMEPINVVLTLDDGLFFNGDPVDLDDLRIKAAQQAAEDPSRKVRLKGDRRLTVEQIRPVLRSLQEAGLRHVALAVDEEKANQREGLPPAQEGTAP